MRSIAHLRVNQTGPAEMQHLNAACARVSSTVEPLVSPPGAEVFVDLSAPGSRGLWKALWHEARALFPAVYLGLAGNKLVARIASGVACTKPSRLCLVQPGHEPAFLSPLPTEALWLADTAVHERLRRLGLVRIGQVASVPRSALKQHFGDLGCMLHNWSRGFDLSPVQPLYPVQACESKITYHENPLSDAEGLAHAVRAAAREVALSLAGNGMGCRHLTLTLSGEGGAEHRAEYHSASGGLLCQAQRLGRVALRLLQRLSIAEPVCQVTLVAGSLAEKPREQGALFATTPSRHWEIDDTMDVVRDRFGSSALQRGSALLPPRRERFMAALEQQWLG